MRLPFAIENGHNFQLMTSQGVTELKALNVPRNIFHIVAVNGQPACAADDPIHLIGSTTHPLQEASEPIHAFTDQLVIGQRLLASLCSPDNLRDYGRPFFIGGIVEAYASPVKPIKALYSTKASRRALAKVG